jgi:hypothetical protein
MLAAHEGQAADFTRELHGATVIMLPVDGKHAICNAMTRIVTTAYRPKRPPRKRTVHARERSLKQMARTLRIVIDLEALKDPMFPVDRMVQRMLDPLPVNCATMEPQRADMIDDRNKVVGFAAIEN